MNKNQCLQKSDVVGIGVWELGLGTIKMVANMNFTWNTCLKRKSTLK